MVKKTLYMEGIFLFWEKNKPLSPSRRSALGRRGRRYFCPCEKELHPRRALPRGLGEGFVLNKMKGKETPVFFIRGGLRREGGAREENFFA